MKPLSSKAHELSHTKLCICDLPHVKIKEVKSSNWATYKYFNNKKNLIKLAKLYQASQQENTRNGQLTTEVGSSREKDLVAFLKYNQDLKVKYNIDNKDEADCKIKGRKTSIKHISSNRIGPNGLKIKWTSNKEKQKEFINDFTFTCDLLLVFVKFEDIMTLTLEIIFINKGKLQKLYEQSKGEKVFKALNGNSRGIEFEKSFFNKMMDNKMYHLVANIKKLSCKECDPITKRMKLLEIF